MIRMKELAEYLKSERLKQGVALQEMSERVRVSIGMLQALEEGDYERIGTSLLIRSFVRAYCGSLGIDSQPLLDKYASEILSLDQQDEGIRRFGRWSKAFRKKNRIGVFTLLLLGIAVLGVVYGGALFWKSRENSGASQSLKTSGYPQQDLPSDLSDKGGQGIRSESKEGAAVVTEKSARSPSEVGGTHAEQTQTGAGIPKTQESLPPKLPAVGAGSAEMLREPTEKPIAANQSAEKHQFSAEANQKTWIQVTMDDKNTQNAMLEPGDKRQWEAEKTMKIVVGNAGGIRMKWDGRPVEVPAKAGSVIRFGLPDQRYIKE
jgi:cytoskeleton protein RodZ